MSAAVRVPSPENITTETPSRQSPNGLPTPTTSKLLGILPKRPINWELLEARSKQWAWTLVTKIPLMLVYFVFISQGIRYLAPESANKLYTLPMPFVAYLEDFESTYQLEVSHAAAELLLVFSFASWSFLLRWVLADDFKQQFRTWKWNSEWVQRILLTCAILIIVGDAGLFYESFTYSAFGRSAFSPKAFIAMLVYAVILVMVNFVSLYLSQRVRALKTKE